MLQVCYRDFTWKSLMGLRVSTNNLMGVIGDLQGYYRVRQHITTVSFVSAFIFVLTRAPENASKLV